MLSMTPDDALAHYKKITKTLSYATYIDKTLFPLIKENAGVMTK